MTENEKESKHNENSDYEYKREKWSSKFEFYLACFAVGAALPSVSLYPFLGNFNVASIIPIFILVIVIIIPLYFLQSFLGQFSSCGFISVYNIAPLFKGFGYATLLTNIFHAVIDMPLVLYPMYYFYNSLLDPIPFHSCKNVWNSPYCSSIDSPYLTEINSYSIENRETNVSGIDFSKYRPITPAEEFFAATFHGFRDPNNTIIWPIFGICFLSWLVVCLLNLKSIKIIPKFLYFSIPLSLIILIAVFVRAITLPEAEIGLTFYTAIKWQDLLSLEIWMDAGACVLSFLGFGLGIFQTLASYNHFSSSIKIDSIIVPVIWMILGFLPGIIIYLFLGYVAFVRNYEVGQFGFDSIISHYGIIPDAMSTFPITKLWLTSFYLMLILLNLNRIVIIIDTVARALLDEWPVLRRRKFIFLPVLCLICCGLTVPLTSKHGFNIQQIIMTFTPISDIMSYYIQIMIVMWCYGEKRLRRDMNFMISHGVEKIWFIAWKFVTPVGLLLIFALVLCSLVIRSVDHFDRLQMNWCLDWAFVIAFGPFLCVIIYAVIKILYLKGSISRRLKNSLRPYQWAPAQSDYRERFELIDNKF